MHRRLSAAVRTPAVGPVLTRERALRTAEGTSALAHLVSGLEYLTREQDRRPGGINDWALGRQNHSSRSRWTRAWLDVVSHRQVTRAVHLCQVPAAVALLLPTGHRTRAVATSFLALADLLLYPRRNYGTDGSDQAAFVVQAAAAVARLTPGTRTTDAALWYVALQSTLSYAVSGWAKVAGPTWRGGGALPGVLRTLTYGDERAWRLARRYPWAARALGVATVVMECSFPLVYARRRAWRLALVGAAGTFHLAIARVMGLNRFLTAFVAMHPAVLYTAGPRRRPGPDGTIETRDDLVPAVVAAAGAVAVAALVLGHVRRTAVVRAGRGDEQLVTTSSGSVLAYRRSSGSRAGGPLVVLENGLATTAQHWERIREVVGRDADVLTYDRAGTGRSRRAPGRDRTVDDAVTDTAELVRAVAPARPVVLVGHSLGGFLAWRTARVVPGVVGLVLLDPSHPAELARSATQRAGAEAMGRQLAAMERNLRFGLGALVATPPWTRHLPESVRALTMAQQRHASTWGAARREWAAAQRAFDDDEHALAPLDVPVLVLTAAHTLEVDPVVGELHDDMVACAGPGSARRTVTGTNHQTLLVGRRQAEHVAGLVVAFVGSVSEAGGGSSVPTHVDGGGGR